MRSSEYCLLVSSFDKYSACWEPFTHGLQKYWPNHPRTVMITNHLDAPRGISTIKIGEDRGWAGNLRYALQLLSEEYIIYCQEDYWIKRPVEDALIQDYMELLREDKVDYIRLYPAPPPDIPCPGDERLGLIQPESQYRTSLQMAIWRKSVLMELLRDNETPWQFEVNGSERSKKYQDRFLSVTKRRFGVDYVFTAIVNGYWSEKAYEYSRIEGIRICFESLPRKNVLTRMNDSIITFGYRVKKKIGWNKL